MWPFKRVGQNDVLGVELAILERAKSRNFTHSAGIERKFISTMPNIGLALPHPIDGAEV
ncbi:MAG TPA: hypothetical protein V6C86_25685 [Oculatellaceae cyanobacterium]